MPYHPLPQIEYNIRTSNINLQIKEKESKKKFSNPSLRYYLTHIKGLIDENIDDWDTNKKYTNPYEFIHTNIPNFKTSISKIKPISRAFFKLIEIYNDHNIFVSDAPIKSFHLAEGPGGFIEATTYIRNNTQDTYYGMTLIDQNNNNIPGWKKAEYLMKKYPNINIEYGADKQGNLYNHNNLEYCKNLYRNSMDVITADGGLDFSMDFNNQEEIAFKLIFSQVMYALTMQKYNGHFILKMFDTFDSASIDIIYMLSCFYENVYINKPHTSRYANSEKYIVCKKFKYSNTVELTDKFISILKQLNAIDFNRHYISKIINIPIQHYYYSQIQEINAILGQQQIDTILSTIKLITYHDRKQDKIQYLKTNNAQKCVNWCIKNNIPYNIINQSVNIFLGERINKKV